MGCFLFETELKKHYTLVSAYFGKGAADSFCHSSGVGSIPINFDPVPNFLPRSLVRYQTIHNQEDYSWLFDKSNLVELYKLFTLDISKRKRICIIGDAYQGKTTLLKQFAHQAFNGQLKLKPIFVAIKDFSRRHLTDILEQDFTWWKTFPIKEVILIVDGMDEVESETFTDSIKQINELTTRLPHLSVIFSCRKLFINYGNVFGLLKGFEYYDLYPLQTNQVEAFFRPGFKKQQV